VPNFIIIIVIIIIDKFWMQDIGSSSLCPDFDGLLVAAAILKNRKIALTPQWIVQF